MIKYFFCLVIVVLSFTSCKKYAVGSLLSVKSKNVRVANVWKVQSVKNLNGSDATALFLMLKWELTPNYSIIYSIDQTKNFGRWQFTQNNENLEFVFDNLPTKTYIIKKLLDKEMVLTDRSNDITITLVPVA